MVDDSVNFRAITVLKWGAKSLPLYYADDYTKYKVFGKFAAKWNHATISETLSTLKFEATGKIVGNGKYEVNFIAFRGDNTLEVVSVELFKRDDKIAESDQLFEKSGTIASFVIDVTSFEAGTPFFIEAMVKAVGGVDSAGAIFIRKL